MRVPSSWFGKEYAALNPSAHFTLDIKEICPETKTHRRRLLLAYGEEEYFHCDRKDFETVIRPYLVPIVEPLCSEGFVRSSDFGTFMRRVEVDDSHAFCLLGK